MVYTERLLQDSEYLALVKKLEQAEEERRFCRHGLSHFLDVARIAWIRTLEQTAQSDSDLGGRMHTEGKQALLNTSEASDDFRKEQIYLTALLHDLGRVAQLERGTPHHQAGVEFARYFLAKIGFPVEDREEILNAVQGHRGEQKSKNDFINRIKEADNYSRNCFCCEARTECKWSEERKNHTIWW